MPHKFYLTHPGLCRIQNNRLLIFFFFILPLDTSKETALSSIQTSPTSPFPPRHYYIYMRPSSSINHPQPSFSDNSTPLETLSQRDVIPKAKPREDVVFPASPERLLQTATDADGRFCSERRKGWTTL